MELYHWPMSHNARKARAVARHLNLDVTEISLSMSVQEHKTEGFLAINPMGQIPAVKDGDYTVWEGNAVLIYLAAQAENDLLGRSAQAENDLLGRSAQEWGSIAQWLLWQTAELSPVVVPLHVENYFKRVRGVEADSARRDEAMGRLRTLLNVLDAALEGKTFLVSERLTVADSAVGGDFSHARNARFPLDDYPNVARWLAAIEALPAWAETAPPHIG